MALEVLFYVPYTHYLRDLGQRSRRIFPVFTVWANTVEVIFAYSPAAQEIVWNNLLSHFDQLFVLSVACLLLLPIL